MTTTVYVTIGNTDGKLSHREWVCYAMDVFNLINNRNAVDEVYGEWFSEPTSQKQNACIAFAYPGPDHSTQLRSGLRSLAARYRQEAIAWVEGETSFIKPAGAPLGGKHARRPEDEHKVGTIVGHDYDGVPYIWTGTRKLPMTGQWLLKDEFPDLWVVLADSLANIDHTENNFRLPDFRGRIMEDTPPQ